jgi:hypothetical protein
MIPHINAEGMPMWGRIILAVCYLGMTVCFLLAAYQFYKRSKGR